MCFTYKLRMKMPFFDALIEIHHLKPQLNMLLEREIIAEKFDNGLPRVVEMIVKEVDDEGEREQQQQQKTGWSVDRHAQRAQDQKAVDRPVDRSP